MRISIEKLNDRDVLLRNWRALYARAVNANFFLSPDWFSCWLSLHPFPGSLFIIEGRAEGELALLGVLSRKHTGRTAPFMQDAAYFNECGERSLDKICIEHNDFLVGANAPKNARTLAAADIISASPAKEIVFRRASKELKECVEEITPLSGYRYRELSQLPKYEVDLRGLSNKRGPPYSGSVATRLRRSAERYEKRGELRVFLTEAKADKQAAFSKLIDLHTEGWRRRNRKGVFSEEAFLAFHRQLLDRAPQNTHILVCAAGKETIGVLYNFVDGKRILNYQSGFLYEDDNKLRPGYVTHALAVNFYAEKGFHTYDFLAGDARYKRELGVEAEILFSFVLEKMTVRSAARAMLKFAGAYVSGEGKRRT